MGFWNKITGGIQSFTDSLTGEDKNKKLESQAADLRAQAAAIQNKDISTLQQEGRGAAAQAAQGKAGEAKKASKAATMQSGGNKLQAATNAASAAGNAATEGFDASSQAYTQMAQNQDIQSKNAQRQALEAEAAGKERQAAAARQKQQAQMQAASTLAGSMMSSDETKKKVKHTYIPANERRGNK